MKSAHEAVQFVALKLIYGWYPKLCGRLPLCLNIVGQLIRTFGAGWFVSECSLGLIVVYV